MSEVAPRKIALVLGGPNYHLAPFDDPTWEIWSLSWLLPKLPRADRAYEMHARNQWHLTAYPDQEQEARPEEFVPFLKTLDIPIICREVYPDIPFSCAFRKERAMEILGWDTPNFASTISYMLADAVVEHEDGPAPVEVVALWGVTLLAAGEWAYQRPNANRLAGFLEGRGVKIYTPPGCALLGIPFEYGFGDAEEFDDQANAMMIESFAQYNDAVMKGLAHLHRMNEREKAAKLARMNGETP